MLLGYYFSYSLTGYKFCLNLTKYGSSVLISGVSVYNLDVLKNYSNFALVIYFCLITQSSLSKFAVIRCSK
jgi:hypothetical protein